MAETTHPLRFKIIFFLWIGVLLIGGGAFGCAGGMGMSGGMGFGPSLMNGAQDNGQNSSASNSENDNPNDSPGGPPAGGPGTAGAGPKGSPGTLIISGGGDHPSGQPTEIAAAPVIWCGPKFACPPPAHQEWKKTVSGRIELPQTSSPEECQKPSNIPITVKVWEKKVGQEDFSPSQDPNDATAVDSWGSFWHILHIEAHNGICDRSVKYKATYEWEGTAVTLGTKEYDCFNLPPEQSFPSINACPIEDPDGEDPSDRIPPWKGGKHGHDDDLPLNGNNPLF